MLAGAFILIFSQQRKPVPLNTARSPLLRKSTRKAGTAVQVAEKVQPVTLHATSPTTILVRFVHWNIMPPPVVLEHYAKLADETANTTIMIMGPGNRFWIVAYQRRLVGR